MAVDIAFRILFAGLFGYLGWRWGVPSEGVFVFQGQQWPLTSLGALLGVAMGLAVGPYLSVRPFQWAMSRLSTMSSHTFVAGVVGAFLGLVLAALLTLPLAQLPGFGGQVLPIICAIFFGFFGAQVLTKREQDIAHLLAAFSPPGGNSTARSGFRGDQVILDTSAIIDGRIADISQMGFIQGTMIIPRFVLQELQHIADSSDPLRRNRGRRGLDMLNKLQKESDVPLQISEMDFDDVPQTDAKLIRMAQLLRCPLITNDFNLNRVAELQGVRVLNINELANAVKTVVLPGEEMTLRIIQEGREATQGVGFLDDGTMVVVDNGKRYINSQLDIVVTRVLQTMAGRMIFAHPK